MPIRLTTAQQEAYERDGFVAPIDIFSPAEAADIRAALEEAERRWPEGMAGANRNNAHYVLPALDAITHDSRILDAVEDLIGPAPQAPSRGLQIAAVGFHPTSLIDGGSQDR